MKLIVSLLLLVTFSTYAYNFGEKLSLGLDYGIPFPQKEDVFKDNLDEDWSGGVYLRYHFNGHNAVELAYDSMNFDEPAGTTEDFSQNTLTFNYLFNVLRADSRSKIFASLGAGVGQLKQTNAVLGFGKRGSDDYYKTTFKAGIGYEYFITTWMNLGLNMDYHYTLGRGDDAQGRSTDLHVFNPSVSVGFLFGAASFDDSDKDAIPDKVDQCPNTPAGQSVDDMGCSAKERDNDSDGVSDADDKCPETPHSEKVDEYGCSSSQKDSDNDGISDLLDQCPSTQPGKRVNSAGCMEKETVEITLNVNFALGSSEVADTYSTELAKVADFLKTYPDTKAAIEGHSDSSGSREKNMKLSQARADSVKNYLVTNHGVNPERLTSIGYGPDKPIADNNTPEGRKTNRRVVATFSTKE